MEETPYEIERKFLIRMPDEAFLASLQDRSHIVQTYLQNESNESSERVRKREYSGHTVYTHTIKTHISSIRRVEIEREIGKDEYESLLLRADPKRHSIEKTRYCLYWDGLTYEIDVFPFWEDKAFMEIELKDEYQCFPWPKGIFCIREVTDDRRYTNAALALHIPTDDEQKEVIE